MSCEIQGEQILFTIAVPRKVIQQALTSINNRRLSEDLEPLTLDDAAELVWEYFEAKTDNVFTVLHEMSEEAE